MPSTTQDLINGLLLSGTIAARPAAGIADRYYWATDEHILYHDTGAAWEKAAVADHLDLDGVTADQHHTHATVLSPAFSVDAVAVVAVTIPHGLAVTPAVEDCQLTVVEDTDVDDWGEGYVKVESVDAVNVVAKVNVTAASATGGATAKLALHVSLI